MEETSTANKNDQAMEEVEELDGHALHLSHKLSSVQKENMDMQMAITVLQEKIQRMEAKGQLTEGIPSNSDRETQFDRTSQRTGMNQAGVMDQVGGEREGRRFQYGRGGFRRHRGGINQLWWRVRSMCQKRVRIFLAWRLLKGGTTRLAEITTTVDERHVDINPGRVLSYGIDLEKNDKFSTATHDCEK